MNVWNEPFKGGTVEVTLGNLLGDVYTDYKVEATDTFASMSIRLYGSPSSRKAAVRLFRELRDAFEKNEK